MQIPEKLIAQVSHSSEIDEYFVHKIMLHSKKIFSGSHCKASVLNKAIITFVATLLLSYDSWFPTQNVFITMEHHQLMNRIPHSIFYQLLSYLALSEHHLLCAFIIMLWCCKEEQFQTYCTFCLLFLLSLSLENVANILLVIISNFNFSVPPLVVECLVSYVSMSYSEVQFALHLYFVEGISIFPYIIAKLELMWALREITKVLSHFMKKKRMLDFFSVPLHVFTLHISLDYATLSQSHAKTVLYSVFYKNTAEICSPISFQSNLEIHWYFVWHVFTHVALSPLAGTIELF